MTVIKNIQNYYDDEDRNKPGKMVYNLDEEKKMIAEATEEIKKELWEKWQKRYAGAQIFPNALDDVNPNLVDFLLSFNNTLFYNDLAKKFNLNQAQRDTLPQIIWEIAKSKNWESAVSLLNSKLNLNPETSNQIIQPINQNILFMAKELSESKFVPRNIAATGGKKESPKLELSLLQAMRTYSNLGEQVVTSNSIHLKIFPQPVRPSIKNWIEDYRSVMGAERHGMMERGNYLFHTENTKRLTSGERKKLAEILRSLDEDVTLKVDPDRQEIVFEQAEEMKPVEKMTNYQNNSLSNPNVGGSLDKKENVQNISRLNFQASKQQIPNYPQSNPLLKSDDGMRASQNMLNQNFQSSNNVPDANVRFSSPQTFSSEKKPEPARAPFQQSSNYPSRDSRVSAISQSNRKTGYTNPRAGKPWEPASIQRGELASTQRGEPKVSGNTVDLRN